MRAIFLAPNPRSRSGTDIAGLILSGAYSGVVTAKSTVSRTDWGRIGDAEKEDAREPGGWKWA